MSKKSKAPEEWITFLLTLIDHTPNFKPDWESFAQDTGLYKRGKFVQQAYNGLRQKHAATDASAPSTPRKVNTNTTPKTPGTGTKEVNKTPTQTQGRKRKAKDSSINDIDVDGSPTIEDDHEAAKPKVKQQRKKTTAKLVRERTIDEDDNGNKIGADEGGHAGSVKTEDGNHDDSAEDPVEEFIRFED